MENKAIRSYWHPTVNMIMGSARGARVSLKPISDAWAIQIPVTNACVHRCANCYRLIGHYKTPYFMDMKAIEQAIDSLEGFQGGIGITGGEPTLHPEFRSICELLQQKVPAYRCVLGTSGYKWNEYKEVIKKTFSLGAYYNDHTDPNQKHQPVLVGIDEVIDDKQMMWKMIDSCWFQQEWCPSITPKGAFFCEIAGALDQALEGPGGYPITKGWWLRKPEEFRDQVRRYCPKCSVAIPLERPSNQEAHDMISRLNYERLLTLDSPKALEGKVQIFDKKLGRSEISQQLSSWRPWDYLSGGKRSRYLKLDEIVLIQNNMRKIRWVFKAVVEGRAHGARFVFYNAKGVIRKKIHRSFLKHMLE